MLAAALVLGWVCPASANEQGPSSHVRALAGIASANGGNRAAGTPGYDKSAEYVADKLRAAGFVVHLEEFTYPFVEERSPPVLSSADDSTRLAFPEGALRTLSQSGSGEVWGLLRPVDLGLVEGQAPGPSNSACEPEDFAGFERGEIALVRRGTCPFQVKVENAEAAGAAAVVIMNEGTPDRLERFGGALSRPASVPVIGIPFEHGRLLALREPSRVRVKVDVVRGTRSTRNVLAETSSGNPAETVVIGAHLDSVPEGPGMNDNASGSAAVLEAALRVAQSGGPARRLRFAFWGAEELGLLGSRHHVDRLSDAERGNIALYINLDMVGSPNYGRFVQARGEELTGLQAVASAAIVRFFQERGLPVSQRVRGRSRGFGSDDASFARKGVATLFLYTGAGEPKDDAAAALFGGTAGRPYDPCYHQACDGIENVEKRVLDEMTEALMHAVFAVSASNETGKR